jgi:hypothetical protein
MIDYFVRCARMKNRHRETYPGRSPLRVRDTNPALADVHGPFLAAHHRPAVPNTIRRRPWQSRIL